LILVLMFLKNINFIISQIPARFQTKQKIMAISRNISYAYISYNKCVSVNRPKYIDILSRILYNYHVDYLCLNARIKDYERQVLSGRGKKLRQKARA